MSWKMERNQVRGMERLDRKSGRRMVMWSVLEEMVVVVV
jgi:hypothetical protein